MEINEREARIDLAAAFRWAVRFDMHEAVSNHFSLAVGENGGTFLINPRGRHFSRIRASELLLLDGADGALLAGGGPPDQTAWFIHSQIHRTVPRARCILHTHMRHATALASLKGWRLEPIDQNAMRFYDRIAYDDTFNGMALEAGEGGRMAGALGNKDILFLASHGVVVIAETVAQAMDDLYYLERACTNQLLALSTGRVLNVVSDDIARRTCQQWRDYPDLAALHFAELKAILDGEEPEYAH